MPLLGSALRRIDHDGPTSPFTPCLKAQLANSAGHLKKTQDSELGMAARDGNKARQDFFD